MFKTAQIRRIFMLAAGLLAAMVILFTQVSYFDDLCNFQASEKSREKAAEGQKPQESTTQVNVSAVTVPSILIINQNQILPLLFELVQSEEGPQLEESEFEIGSAKLVKYLFRVIIAPNAP
jgi:hypothetical protein